MEQLEERSRTRMRQTRIQDGVLLALYGTATLTMALTAPNALKILRGFDANFTKKRKPSYRIQQALKRLEARGLVLYEKQDGRWRVSLTGKGKKLAEKMNSAERIVIRKPRRWDGKWRIVIFDIWERRKPVREKLRALLKKAGFSMIQDSVWAHPYPCEELIAFIRNDLRLGRGILYIIAEGIENDHHLKRRFGLE